MADVKEVKHTKAGDSISDNKSNSGEREQSLFLALSSSSIESAAIAKGEELMFGSVVAEFFDELIGRTKDVLR